MKFKSFFLSYTTHTLQDGSARKHPFPIDVQPGSIRKKRITDYLISDIFYLVYTAKNKIKIIAILWVTLLNSEMDICQNAKHIMGFSFFNAAFKWFQLTFIQLKRWNGGIMTPRLKTATAVWIYSGVNLSQIQTITWNLIKLWPLKNIWNIRFVMIVNKKNYLLVSKGSKQKKITWTKMTIWKDPALTMDNRIKSTIT